VVALGVVIGFPLLSAWALQKVPASHGAIVVGLLPLATAIAGVVRAGERPAPRFWLFSLGGTVLVVGYVLWAGGGRLQLADVLLLGAVVAALGYAEGGRLAREMGGWQVICWALLLAAPLVTGPVLWSCWQHGLQASPKAWAGFAYVSAVSMFLGFFAWYKGLALGGIARVGQVQLLQPFLTLTASAALLGERLSVGTLVVSVLVVGVVAAGRHASSTPEARRSRVQPQPSSKS
jgi:drug/metabolite transporter (DMT)-like permease